MEDSARLLELDDEDVDRDLRIEDDEVVRVVRVPQKIAFVHELESGRLDRGARI